ncbi:hypothetical protein [Jiella pelagia]|uniref:Uncharacterized protein n=1 Tax=Jiella pelagia TaxID=2986949 RepID=A0ABY7C3F6_9HYPH|nr:hypothetical protein [Jiella pelagia]WAP69298.1 hypothetical protein OH818_03085 [Jiella pelagia]
MSAVTQAITERNRIWEAWLSAANRAVPEDEMKARAAIYNKATEAWQAAPCESVADILAKVKFALTDATVLKDLQEGDGELERFLRSIAGVADGDSLDRDDAIDVVMDMLDGLLVFAKGMELRHEGDALAALVEATIKKMDEVAA